MEKECVWDNDHAANLVHGKKAVEACLFICFLGYTAAVAISEFKKTTKVRKQFISNLYYRSEQICANTFQTSHTTNTSSS